jgi:hypothetical protein
METYVSFRVINVLCGSRSGKLPVEPPRTLCESDGHDFRHRLVKDNSKL